MAKSRLNEFLKAALGIYVAYVAIVILRAGYETGQVLAGKATIAEAFARFDSSGTALVVCGFVLFAAMGRTPSK